MQVCTVLDSLEREYKRDEDWCGGGANSGVNIAQLVNKHQEQKEAFLKACTLARRTAETFLKYTSRSLQYYNYGSEAGSESRVKGTLPRVSFQKIVYTQFDCFFDKPAHYTFVLLLLCS